MRTTKKWLWLGLPFLGVILTLFFSLELYQKPHFIQNFEEEEYEIKRTILEPVSVVDGLAVYATGSGLPVLLFPYPHGHTTEPMAQGPIAEILAGMSRTVVTFDVPGAYRSTLDPVGDMAEMIRSADETLDRLGIEGPVDVVGHSMGGLAALAYAIERPGSCWSTAFPASRPPPAGVFQGVLLTYTSLIIGELFSGGFNSMRGEKILPCISNCRT